MVLLGKGGFGATHPKLAVAEVRLCDGCSAEKRFTHSLQRQVVLLVCMLHSMQCQCDVTLAIVHLAPGHDELQADWSAVVLLHCRRHPVAAGDPNTALQH